MFITAIFVFAGLLFSISSGQSCQTITQIATSDPRFSTLATLLSNAGLIPALQNATLTVFAPVNQAFANVNIAPNFPVPDILTYHVVAGSYDISNLQDGQQLTTLQGANVTVDFRFGRLELNSYAGVVQVVNACFNSRIFVVDHVLIPPCGSGHRYPTALDQVVANAQLSVLGQLVTASGLSPALAGPGHLTVFAPINSAFAALNLPNNLTTQQLQQIILYHVAPQRYLKSDLVSGFKSTTLNGDSLSFEGGIINGAAMFVTSSIVTCNAVVHVIDHVLLPHGNYSPFPDLATTILRTPTLSSLAASLTKNGLINALRGPNQLTVFGPNNIAFSQLTSPQICCLAVSQILLYHVTPGALLSSDLSPLEQANVTTLLTPATLELTGQLGGSLFITAERDTANVLLSQSNIPCSNGILHTIDTVLLPLCRC